MESAQAQLVNSRESYLRVVGKVATALDPPPPLPTLPTDPGAAVEIAIDNNPALIAAKKASDAAAFDVRVAQSQRLPAALGGRERQLLQLSELARQQRVRHHQLRTARHHRGGGRAADAAAVPRRLPAAQVRRAQAVQGQQLEAIVEVERSVIAQTRSALSSYAATQAVIARPRRRCRRMNSR